MAWRGRMGQGEVGKNFVVWKIVERPKQCTVGDVSAPPSQPAPAAEHERTFSTFV